MHGNYRTGIHNDIPRSSAAGPCTGGWMKDLVGECRGGGGKAGPSRATEGASVAPSVPGPNRDEPIYELLVLLRAQGQGTARLTSDRGLDVRTATGF